jgi:hypothetical protein
VYRTCLFCSSDLGANEAIEKFPVGRRLAFDPARGRLWVVCRACDRWNLTPLEERWEAIEQCERLFRATPLRASTDNVGLAKLPEGLTLIRVGEPARPEFAAWRYGEIFTRRRRRWYLAAGATVAVAIGVQFWGIPLILGVAGGSPFIWNLPRFAMRAQRRLRTYGAIIGDDGKSHRIRGKHLSSAILLPRGSDEMPALSIVHSGGPAVLEGDAATRVLNRVLAGINLKGGTREEVSDAVKEIEHARSPDQLIRQVARQQHQYLHTGRTRHSTGEKGSPAAIAALAPAPRLALEMSLHEESERLAMEGELAALEDAWKEAEEIAEISDNLLLPAGVMEAMKRLKGIDARS